MSYQQCTRFRTTLNFDRENIWNGSSNRDKRKTALSTTIFPTFEENNLVNFGPLTKNMTVTFELNKVREVAKVHVHAKHHQAVQRFIELTNCFAIISQW